MSSDSVVSVAEFKRARWRAKLPSDVRSAKAYLENIRDFAEAALVLLELEDQELDLLLAGKEEGLSERVLEAFDVASFTAGDYGSVVDVVVEEVKNLVGKVPL